MRDVVISISSCHDFHRFMYISKLFKSESPWRKGCICHHIIILCLFRYSMFIFELFKSESP